MVGVAVLAVSGKDGSRLFSFADGGFFLGSSSSAMAAGKVRGRHVQHRRVFNAADGKTDLGGAPEASHH